MSKANPNFTYLKSNVPNQRVTLLQGGTRSGKTFSTIYYFIWLCNTYNGLEIDIVRDTFTALKSTVWKDFKQVLVLHNLYHPSHHNKTDKMYNLNGNIISYYGADDPGKIHGRSRDILWINECNQLDEETIDQLFPRTRHKIIMDYNPALPTEHWINSYIDKYPPLITTYKDNTHLTKAQIEDIESKKDNDYWWSVYGTGERTKPTGTIINNWIEGEFDTTLPYVYGLDFGVSDPDALIKVAVDSKKMKIYVDECMYINGQSTSQLIESLTNIVNKNDLIAADYGDKRAIEDLQEHGFNAVNCTKDRITDRIKNTAGYTFIVTPRSTNIKKEFSNWIWHSKRSEVPIDKFNHTIDAIFYGYNEFHYQTPTYFS